MSLIYKHVGSVCVQFHQTRTNTLSPYTQGVGTKPVPVMWGPGDSYKTCTRDVGTWDSYTTCTRDVGTWGIIHNMSQGYGDLGNHTKPGGHSHVNWGRYKPWTGNPLHVLVD